MRNLAKDSRYRTLCCHVKSATLAWGFLNVILQLIVLASFAMIVINPNYAEKGDMTSSLKLRYNDNLLSSLFNDDKVEDNLSLRYKEPTLRTQYLSFKVHDFNLEDAHIGLIITLCALLLTSLLIHGVLSGKPGYLIPFFSLQIFDLSLTVLTFLGYYTYSPSLQKYFATEASQKIPFKSQISGMNSSYLSITTFLIFMTVITFKLYFINVVWNCYKYLCSRKQILKINYIKVEPETSSLPDYETAVKMPPTDFIIPSPAIVSQNPVSN